MPTRDDRVPWLFHRGSGDAVVLLSIPDLELRRSGFGMNRVPCVASDAAGRVASVHTSVQCRARTRSEPRGGCTMPTGSAATSDGGRWGNCEERTPHAASVEIRAESASSENPQYSREPYRSASVGCGTTEHRTTRESGVVRGPRPPEGGGGAWTLQAASRRVSISRASPSTVTTSIDAMAAGSAAVQVPGL